MEYKESKLGLPTEINNALTTLSKIPGLSPVYSADYGIDDDHALHYFALRPTCGFKSTQEADAFAKKLAQLCVPASPREKFLSILNPGRHYRDVEYRGEGDRIYISIDLFCSNNDCVDSLKMQDRFQLRDASKKISENADKIVALLKENGVDTTAFKGMGQQRA